MPRRRKYPGYLERRGKHSYRWECSINGERVKETFTTRDRATAELLAARRYEELLQERERLVAGLPGTICISALLTLFEESELPTLEPGTIRSYKDSLGPIRTYFTTHLIGNVRDPRVDKIRARDIQDYLTWRRLARRNGDAPLNNRTLAKDRAVLHRLFAFAELREYRQGNPVALTDTPKSDERDPVILTDEEYEKLICACVRYPMLCTFVVVLGEAGLRCESEALHLRWEDVLFERNLMKVVSGRDGHKTKSRKSRYVPMTPRLREALRDHFAKYRLATYSDQRSPYVFHHTFGHRRRRPGERIESLYRGFQSAAKRAKLPEALTQHDLRHRRVTTWLAAGKSPVLVQKAMGHSTIAVTMRYYRFLPDHLRLLVEEPEQAVSPEEMAELNTLAITA